MPKISRINGMATEKEYEPFGKEWENHLLKMTKRTLIMMYKSVCLEKLRLEQILNNAGIEK